MQLADIRDDDPELAAILATLTKPVYPVPEIIENGPAGATKTYAEMRAGRLKTHYCGNRRFAFAADFAKWLLLLKRESEASAKEQERRLIARNRQLTPEVRERRTQRRAQHEQAASA